MQSDAARLPCRCGRAALRAAESPAASVVAAAGPEAGCLALDWGDLRVQESPRRARESPPRWCAGTFWSSCEPPFAADPAAAISRDNHIIPLSAILMQINKTGIAQPAVSGIRHC